MDPNLEEPLTLESVIGVDFEPSGDAVVSQSAITLDSSNHDTSIPMEFENINEEPILMEAENEEIIDHVAEFMDDPLVLQEYEVQEGQSSTTTTTESTQNVLTTHTETMMDLQFYPQSNAQETQVPTKVIAVKAALPAHTVSGQKIEVASTPRQVAIAPKPPKVVPRNIIQKTAAFIEGKQYAIAPKPVALVTNRTAAGYMKKGVGQTNLKPNNVFTQIGKQLVLVPTDGSQKIKLVRTASSASNIQYIKTEPNQTQVIAPKNVSGSKPVMAKIIVQSSGGSTPARIMTMQPKTVPISLANKVLMTSPTKITKKQHIVSLKSPPKLSASAQGPTTKKVVITANPNIVLRSSPQTKTAQIMKDGNVVNVQHGQKSQLHQINVPGKGIQYIRLVTNSNPTAAKSSQSSNAQGPALGAKTFVLSDSKGNLIQMSADKVLRSQPPPLVMTRKPATVKTFSAKPPKLVRLAPLTKSQLVMQQSIKPAQSLLAPITVDASAKETIVPDLVESKCEMVAESETNPESSVEVEVESKEALHELLGEENTREQEMSMHEVQVEFEKQPSASPEEKCIDHEEGDLEQESEQDVERECDSNNDEQPLIVIPSAYLKQQQLYEPPHGEDELDAYQPPHTPLLSDTDMVSNEFGMRPRKACNCTKSQCLKLYCDCFANGEFCNKCNCNNCCNNLENEEFRQKAIRGCLERNPNAFRPKIGKSKSGGPELTRRHNKGCNCKKSGCLKNYCECYEAKIACTATCKCVGCRNVEETLERARRRDAAQDQPSDVFRPAPHPQPKQPCNFLTAEVIEAVCLCLLSTAKDSGTQTADRMSLVLEEFGVCMQDIISAAHQPTPALLFNEERT